MGTIFSLKSFRLHSEYPIEFTNNDLSSYQDCEQMKTTSMDVKCMVSLMYKQMKINEKNVRWGNEKLGFIEPPVFL